MDYIGNKCPVCDRYFHADDDIVVCPECGTPHHRECYEKLGHCVNIDRHAEGYDFSQEAETEKSKVKLCPSCKKENDSEAFFCKHCGAPLSPDGARGNESENSGSAPFSDGTGAAGTPFGMPFLDPLGGVPKDTDLGDGVTVGEAAKYVKQNTPYFIRIFSNIKNFNKSKFNFAAALFMGGYMLYRKMYKLGAIIAGLQLAMMIVELYISIAYSSLFNELAQSYANALNTQDFFANVTGFLSKASTTDLLVIYLPYLIDLMRIVMMIVIGICFNRMYMTHCKKQIIAIKQSVKDSEENAETLLQTKGGVNTALAVSLLISAMLITYLPRILAGVLF